MIIAPPRKSLVKALALTWIVVSTITAVLVVIDRRRTNRRESWMFEAAVVLFALPIMLIGEPIVRLITFIYEPDFQWDDE